MVEPDEESKGAPEEQESPDQAERSFLLWARCLTVVMILLFLVIMFYFAGGDLRNSVSSSFSTISHQLNELGSKK
jgi:hypothetical protein